MPPIKVSHPTLGHSLRKASRLESESKVPSTGCAALYTERQKNTSNFAEVSQTWAEAQDVRKYWNSSTRVLVVHNHWCNNSLINSINSTKRT